MSEAIRKAADWQMADHWRSLAERCRAQNPARTSEVPRHLEKVTRAVVFPKLVLYSPWVDGPNDTRADCVLHALTIARYLSYSFPAG